MKQQVTQAEFSRFMGVSRRAVTHWKQAGRLVLTADGMVDVEASKKRIAASADPARADVVARHAKARGHAVTGAAEVDGDEDDGASFSESKRLRAHYQALTARADYEKQIAGLAPRTEVEAAIEVMSAAATATLSGFADRLAPVLAPVTNIEETHALLAEACRGALEDIQTRLHRQQAALGK